MNHRIIFLTAALLLSLSTSLHADGKVPIDQVPMYGGMDRSAIPELKAGDDKLIADTTNHYGTRRDSERRIRKQWLRLLPKRRSSQCYAQV